MEKLKPIGNNILVKPIEEATTTSGIILAQKEKEKPQKGEVIALGQDLEELNIKVGDKILFKKYSPDEIIIENETFLIMESEAVLCIINE